MHQIRRVAIFRQHIIHVTHSIGNIRCRTVHFHTYKTVNLLRTKGCDRFGLIKEKSKNILTVLIRLIEINWFSIRLFQTVTNEPSSYFSDF